MEDQLEDKRGDKISPESISKSQNPGLKYCLLELLSELKGMKSEPTNHFPSETKVAYISRTATPTC